MSGLAARARRSVFGISGQVLNAATNVVTAYLASLLLQPDAFGAFALAFAVVTVVLAAGRGVVGSTMQVELPAREPAARRDLVRSAIGFTLLVGVAASALLWALGDDALVLFAPWVSVALLQDTARYTFLSVGRQGSALLLDVAWALVQSLAIVGWLLSGGTVTIGLLATCWGLGALAGVALFAVLADARPALPGSWVRATWSLAGWFSGVAVIAQLELYLVLLFTGTLLGPTDAGGLRAVQLLAYQPAFVLFAALSILLTPSMVRARTSRAEIGRAWWRIMVAVSPVAMALVFVAVLREPLMGLLFGQYVAFAALVVPVALQGICTAVGVPSIVMLRALRRGATVFVLQTLRALLIVVAALAGLTLGGATGLAWGLAAGSATVLLLISATALRVSRQVEETSSVGRSARPPAGTDVDAE